MKYREFGLGQKETILLLHGGGLSWWNYLEAAKLLQTDFHIILPILDGHAGSDRPFTTIEENASEIISFIDAQFGTSVLMIGGLADEQDDRSGTRGQLWTDQKQRLCKNAVQRLAH